MARIPLVASRISAAVKPGWAPPPPASLRMVMVPPVNRMTIISRRSGALPAPGIPPVISDRAPRSPAPASSTRRRRADRAPRSGPDIHRSTLDRAVARPPPAPRSPSATGCRRARDASPRPAPQERGCPPSSSAGEMLSNEIRRFGDNRCHPLGVGNASLRHVGLASSLPARGSSELAQNRVGANALLPQIVADHGQHCILAVLKRCRENADTRFHLLPQRVAHCLQRGKIWRADIGGDDFDSVNDRALLDKRLDGAAPAAAPPHRLVNSLFQRSPLVDESLHAAHDLTGRCAQDVLDLLQLSLVTPIEIQGRAPGERFDSANAGGDPRLADD